MDKPHVAERRPCVATLPAGTYWWCRCGLSKNQPYCDGSHAGTSFLPMEVTLTEEKKVALCQCKATQNPPYCDGAHRNV